MFGDNKWVIRSDKLKKNRQRKVQNKEVNNTKIICKPVHRKFSLNNAYAAKTDCEFRCYGRVFTSYCTNDTSLVLHVLHYQLINATDRCAFDAKILKKHTVG